MYSLETQKIIEEFEKMGPDDEFAYEKYREQMAATLLKDKLKLEDYVLNHSNIQELYWFTVSIDIMVDKIDDIGIIELFRERLNRLSQEIFETDIKRFNYLNKKLNYSQFKKIIEDDINFAEGRIGLNNLSMDKKSHS